MPWGERVERPFFLAYTLVSVAVYFVALPFVFILSFFSSKYRFSIPARFWLKNNPPFPEGGVWFHVCSFGEARAIRPLLDAVPSDMLRMSTTTQTGMSVIKSYTPHSRYLPFEPLLFRWIRPQKVLVVFEAELWYLLFVLAKRRGARTMLVNARISERSYPKYKRFAWLYRRIFAHIDEVYAQTEEDKKRLMSLGARNVKITGNIKLASLPQIGTRYKKPSSLTVCAASTHEGEEEAILEAFAALKSQRQEAVLIVVPRHPERFERVAKMIDAAARTQGWRWERFSRVKRLSGYDVVLVDAMGELVNCYNVSDVVVLGGSFVPVGGHNAAEAAQFGCRIVSGPHVYNQRDVYGAIEGIVITQKRALLDILTSCDRLKKTRIIHRSDIDTIKEAIRRAYTKEIASDVSPS